MSQTLAPSAPVTHRDRKGGKFMDIVAAAYDKAGLDEEEAQRINDTPGLAEHVGKFIADNRRPNNRYADQKVRSIYVYPTKYEGPNKIEWQAETLANIFGLSLRVTLEFLRCVLPSRKLSAGAEGRFAVASVDAVAEIHFPEVEDPAERYIRAVNLGFEKLAATRSFYNHRQDQITAERLRRHARTSAALGIIAAQQAGDIHILDAQVGNRHRGRSTNRAREMFVGAHRVPEALLPGDEAGLGTWEGICIALTHPDRFVCWKELELDLPGDEFNDPRDSVAFGHHAPYLRFRGGNLEFDTGHCGLANENYGSGSFFSRSNCRLRFGALGLLFPCALLRGKKSGGYPQRWSLLFLFKNFCWF